jgi:predicted O-linked N-acetylglucosamine transferase (SPINDLY family)
MGVPVVTLLGDRFGGRHSASHLSAVGLQGMVAQGARQYLEIVRTLCADMQALSQLRSGLRDQMLRSALCDGPRFAYNFEKIISSIIASQAGT